MTDNDIEVEISKNICEDMNNDILEQEIETTLNEQLKPVKKRVGRPKVYETDEERKEIYNKYMREYQKRKRKEHRELKFDVNVYTDESRDIMIKMKELLKKKNIKIENLTNDIYEMDKHYSIIIKELVAENHKYKNIVKNYIH